MSISIGTYINRDTHEEYEILEKDIQVCKPSSPHVKVLPSKTYMTQSGDKVTKLSDDLSSFKLSESVIHKKNT